MDTTSVWEEVSKTDISHPTLKKDLHVDVAIIGGGITGITTALELISTDKKIAILEAETIGGSTTGYSTGNLYTAVQPYYQNILKKFDKETVKTVANSRQLIIDYIENVVQQYHIKCHFSRRPWFMYTNNQDNVDFLEKEVMTLKNAGISIDYTQELDIPFKFKKAALMENQARFNPLKYVIAVAKFLQQQNNCSVYENTKVTGIKEEKNQCLVTTKSATVYAKKIIMATHTPKGINFVQLLEAPYRSYVVAAKLKNGHYPNGHYWDLDEPKFISSTHSVFSDKLDMLLVAGDHHKTGQAKNTLECYKKIENYLKNNYDVASIEYQWSAQHYQTIDGLPYIGLAHPGSKNIYIATGFFADGLVYGTLAGLILADMVAGKEKKGISIYPPLRFKLKSIPALVKESSNVFFQYLKDLPFPNNDLENIKPDEAKIVRIKGEKYGAYRNKQGKLHVVSAVCTHMKCIVNWNNAEKTWDCPCHGSRFNTDGEVLEGPAYANLKKLDVSKKDKI